MSVAPSRLVVLPIQRRTAGGQPAANIQDHIPITNIAPFGPCMSPSYPAATAAAGGVFTPAPCVPNTVTPGTPGSPVVTIGDRPALRNTSVCHPAIGRRLGALEAMLAAARPRGPQ